MLLNWRDIDAIRIMIMKKFGDLPVKEKRLHGQTQCSMWIREGGNGKYNA